MNPGIFLIQENDELVEMNEEPYKSEDLLQTLLAKYPALLAGNQINPSAPRKWLFIERESGVPSEKGGSDRWSADHLFLDQEAVPTIVEVKRSSDTRIRREVVGQMLDYAANAVVYWPIERMRETFRTTHSATADEELDKFLDGRMEAEDFWRLANENLQKKKVRLLFVADEIPIELQRIVEFLNEQMRETEVLAVEIKQYVGGEHKGLVPRVIGQTADAIKIKDRKPPKATAEEIIDAIRQESPEGAGIAQRIVDWSFKQEHFSELSTTANNITPQFNVNSTIFRPFVIQTDHKVHVWIAEIKRTPPFNVEENWREFRRRLDEMGVSFPERPRYSGVILSTFANDHTLTKFLKIIAWSIQEVKKAAQQAYTGRISSEGDINK